jgi:hypothetical protein
MPPIRDDIALMAFDFPATIAHRGFPRRMPRNSPDFLAAAG